MMVRTTRNSGAVTSADIDGAVIERDASLRRFVRWSYRTVLLVGAFLVGVVPVWGFAVYRAFYASFGVTPDELGYNPAVAVARAAVVIAASIASYALWLAYVGIILAGAYLMLAARAIAWAERVRRRSQRSRVFADVRTGSRSERKQTKRVVSMLGGSCALAIAAAVVFPAINWGVYSKSLSEHIGEVRAGKGLKYSLYSSMELGQPRATPTWVRWIGERPPPMFATKNGGRSVSIRLTYFGGVAGTLVFLDPRRNRVLRLPASAVAMDARPDRAPY
jgi:hypothetical protein